MIQEIQQQLLQMDLAVIAHIIMALEVVLQFPQMASAVIGVMTMGAAVHGPHHQTV